MREDIVEKIDVAVQTLQELRELKPEILSSYERRMLLQIADKLDEHIDRGEPYDLTFFYDARVPLNSEQKKILKEYLAHYFKNIWGNTWIKGDAKRIRDIVNVDKNTEGET